MSISNKDLKVSAVGLIGYGEAGSLIAGGLARSNPQTAVWVIDPVLAARLVRGHGTRKRRPQA
jgi:3-hydroxyisobutyrate dehydrogenase-like beta-hydroxyacid dehydrogenase